MTGWLLIPGIATCREASAQVISFGSPGDPPRIVIGGGAFDVIHENKPGAGATGSALSEFRFGDQWWILSSLCGRDGDWQGCGLYLCRVRV